MARAINREIIDAADRHGADAVLRVVDAKRASFNAVNLSTAINRLYKLTARGDRGGGGGVDARYDILTRMIREKAPFFGARESSNIMHGVASLHANGALPDVDAALATTMLDAVERNAATLDAQGVSTVLRALWTLPVASRVVTDAQLEALRDRLDATQWQQQQTGYVLASTPTPMPTPTPTTTRKSSTRDHRNDDAGFNAQHVANVYTSLTKLPRMYRAMRASSWATLTRSAETHAPRMNAIEAANAVAAIGKLPPAAAALSPRAWRSLLTRVVDHADAMNARQVTATYSGLYKLFFNAHGEGATRALQSGDDVEILWTRLASAAVRTAPQMDAQAVATTLNALAMLRAKAPAAYVSVQGGGGGGTRGWDALAEAVVREAPAFTPQGVALVIDAAKKLRYLHEAIKRVVVVGGVVPPPGISIRSRGGGGGGDDDVEGGDNAAAAAANSSAASPPRTSDGYRALALAVERVAEEMNAMELVNAFSALAWRAELRNGLRVPRGWDALYDALVGKLAEIKAGDRTREHAHRTRWAKKTARALKMIQHGGVEDGFGMGVALHEDLEGSAFHARGDDFASIRERELEPVFGGWREGECVPGHWGDEDGGGGGREDDDMMR